MILKGKEPTVTAELTLKELNLIMNGLSHRESDYIKDSHEATNESVKSVYLSLAEPYGKLGKVFYEIIMGEGEFKNEEK